MIFGSPQTPSGGQRRPALNPQVSGLGAASVQVVGNAGNVPLQRLTERLAKPPSFSKSYGRINLARAYDLWAPEVVRNTLLLLSVRE